MKKKLDISFKLLAVIILLVFINFKDNVLLICINGSSMEPTLKNNSYHLAVKINYENIAYDDIIVAYNKDVQEDIVKRVIGTSGDTVSLKDGVLMLNSERTRHNGYLSDLYLQYNINDNELFVIGDNVNNSTDSVTLGLMNVENTSIYKVLI